MTFNIFRMMIVMNTVVRMTFSLPHATKNFIQEYKMQHDEGMTNSQVVVKAVKLLEKHELQKMFQDMGKDQEYLQSTQATIESSMLSAEDMLDESW